MSYRLGSARRVWRRGMEENSILGGVRWTSSKQAGVLLGYFSSINKCPGLGGWRDIA